MFGVNKKNFIVLLSSIVNASNHTEYVLLSNHKCEIQPTLINLHRNEYRQKFDYNPFSINLDRCFGSYNTLIDLSDIVCVPNKIEDLNISVFKMITGINESKTLTKHLSCKRKRKFYGKNVIQINGGITITMEDKCESKQIQVYEKEYVWNPSKCICENGKYLSSIMDDSMMWWKWWKYRKSYDEKIKTIPTNLRKTFYVLLAFLLITITLLIAVSICCYMIKYQSKKLLAFHDIKS